jgi:hypothetical protein
MTSAIQMVRWDSGGTEPAAEYTLFYGNMNENHEFGTGFFGHKGIVLAVKRVEFLTDRMSYIILRGRWCDINVLKVHAPIENITHLMRDSLCEELERVFDNFPNYYTKISL